MDMNNILNNMKILNFARVIFLTGVSLLILYSFFYNVFIKSYGEFVISNFVIRDYFYSINDVKSKGTHDNALIKWSQKRLEYKNLIKTIDFKSLKDKVNKLNNIDIKKTNYNKEYQFINSLMLISKEKNSYKRETLIYIPKSQNIFWNLSCDMGMTSFIVPGLTNISMIDGLPIRNKSCYGKFQDYGYGEYDLFGLFPKIIKDFNNEELCQKAKKEGFFRVIEIKYDELEQKIKKNVYICN